MFQNAGDEDLLICLQDVSRSIEQLTSRPDLAQAEIVPHFRSQFEILCQHEACAKGQASIEASTVMSLLAGRPTAQLMAYEKSSRTWDALAQVQRITASGQHFLELATVRNLLPVTVLHQLDCIGEVPLRSLNLLSSEIAFLGRTFAELTATISGDSLRTLSHAIEGLRVQVQAALNTSMTSEALESIRSCVAQLPLQLNARSSDQITLLEQTEHLHQCVASVFGLKKASSDAGELVQTSLECIQLFTGCLLLYVPDRVFDPALAPMVERSRHAKRKAEMQNKLQALKDFEGVFSGQTSSFRIELAEEGLQALGAEPQIPSIVRPQKSGLGQLQAEFNNILKSIVLRSPTPSAYEQVLLGQYSQVQEIRLLRTNIAQAVARLSKGFHVYEDVTKPLIAMLQGMDVGLALALLAGSPSTESEHSIKRLCATTPFLGASPHELLNSEMANANEDLTLKSSSCLQYLKSFAIVRSVSTDIGDSATQGMLQAIHRLYEEWKKKLGHDQQKLAAESSLYRYRGSELDGDEADEQDFKALFPDYSHKPEDAATLSKNVYDPKRQARRLANVHRQIFQSTEKTSARMLDSLKEASHTIARTWQDNLELSKGPARSEDLLSGVIISLDENKARLLDETATGKLYDFYRDANLHEAQKLIDLVHKIQVRFDHLHEAWPEHATLDDVLRTCSELLALRHTEPVAKLLTKTEQLHGYIHEWQVVASKQYTAFALYDRLTDLLVSWRRLELSTWARLLDMEDQKCKDDADLWWFVAYESIVAAPLSLIDTGEDLHRHAEQMFSTLANFLASTSMGQYSHRLGLIECFKSHLELLVSDFPLFGVVHNAVVNFLSFHDRFIVPIQEWMRKGRQTLERDMKDILLLASWKDTNIAALRDSAKRSHHKLFKIVRRYRVLLAQPSEIILAQSFPDKLETGGGSLNAINIAEVAAVESRALVLCQENINGWQTRPERFTNPSSTADRMRQMSQPLFDMVRGASYLNSYGSELYDSIKTLQKETPSTATKENSEAIKHLKARKRKLYAETLKDLRQMGFQSNLNTEALTKQESVSVILTSSPALAERFFASETRAAEYHFHRLLKVMPQLKERLRTHSEDLTNGEVSRSLGHLEGMMSLILRQRAVLATAMSDATQLDRTTRMMQNTWAPDSYIISRSTQGKDVEKVTHGTLKWLPGILEVGSVIVHKHARLGEVDESPVVEIFAEWKERIEGFLRSADELHDLPDGLSSTQHTRVLGDGEQLLQELKTNLDQMVKEYPGLAFVLTQIEHWTHVDIVHGEKHVDRRHSVSLEVCERSLSGVSDSILVAMQRMREACPSTPITEEDPAWLMRSVASLSNALKELHINEVNSLLRGTLSKICEVGAKEGESLEVVGALCAMAVPIVDQYRNIHLVALGRYVSCHESLCKFASLVAHSFSQIAQDGFCTPPESAAPETGTTEKLEGGTGLGEGEGADDISKDVQDEEDLSELAQQRNKDDACKDIEDQEDAVNMDQEELEGEMGDVSDRGDDDGSASESIEDEIDEETGSVDDLDPSAVDEKLWDGRTDEADKKKEGSKTKGKAEIDDQVAAESTEKVEDGLEADEEEDNAMSPEGAEEGEQVAREETEKVDQHAQDGQSLELPEEMELEEADSIGDGAESGESDVDAMSDVEQEPIEGEESRQEDVDDRDDTMGNETIPMEEKVEDEDNEEAAAENVDVADSPIDTDPSDDGQTEDHGVFQEASDNTATDSENVVPSDVRGPGQNMDQQRDKEAATVGQAEARRGAKGSSPGHDAPEATLGDDGLGDSKVERKDINVQDEKLGAKEQSQAFKKLGNALEKWHRQTQQIQDASEPKTNPEQSLSDPDRTDQNFEHLQNEEAEADTQAMGAAEREDATGLNGNGEDLAMLGTNDEAEAISQAGTEGQDEAMAEYEADLRASEDLQEQSQPGAFINDNFRGNRTRDEAENGAIYADEEIAQLDDDFSTTHIETASGLSTRSAEDSRRLWSHYENITRDLSLALTEQLRLILAPTLATKMRGDFRTGKRLNIKRIIPYIASQYKRDKIWMRRSVPSKRNYQIMLAVDDSKSMGESGSGQLAFKTLAIVGKSLNMLEAGEVAVVAFGSKVKVAHPFEKPFTSEAGGEIFQHFGFQQKETNMQKLVAESIQLFREARQKTLAAGTELWQLELIISDGICENHEGIKRLLRQAREEKIMVVFVIVDKLHGCESIMEMSQATFEPDNLGEMKLSIKRYLDSFPFSYYVVVGDVGELPNVLAQALRQWFTETVGSGCDY